MPGTVLKTVGELCIVIGSVGETRPISLIYARVRGLTARKLARPAAFGALFGQAERPVRTLDSADCRTAQVDGKTARIAACRVGPIRHPNPDGRSARAASLADVSAAVHRLHGGRQLRAGAAQAARRLLPDGTPRAGLRTTTGSACEYAHYPIVYTVKIALTIAAMLYVLPGYRQFPFRISLLAIVVGVVGVVLWIWLCQLAARAQRCLTRDRPGQLARPRRTAGVQSARATGRHAGLGLHVSGHPLPRPRAGRADHRRVLPPRLPDAVRRCATTGGKCRSASDAARRRRRHAVPDADAPGRTAGRRSSGSAWSPG